MSTPHLTILQGDVIEQLRTLPDASVQCCVTSPPYYGLRSYLKTDDPAKAHEIGAEETPQAYVARMVEVFREVKRVLREDGVLWLNLGDSYVSKPYKAENAHSFQKTSVGGDQSKQSANGLLCNRQSRLKEAGVKVKDLLMIPARVAIALQQDGWYLRAACPWIKRNGMPESVKDRPAQTIEMLYMLTKSERYHYDAEAVKVNASNNSHSASAATAAKRPNRDDPGSQQRHRASGEQTGGKRTRRSGDWFFESWQGMLQDEEGDPLAFVVNTKPYKGAHFACFPPDLIRPCIKAAGRTGHPVLDPFGGSGTTAQVAMELGHDAILIELNAEYIPLIKQRCGRD